MIEEMTQEQIQIAIAETKASYPDLAVKDTTEIYYNGSMASGTVRRVSDNVKRFRMLNGDKTSLDLIETTNIPKGGMLYASNGKFFAYGQEQQE